MSALSRLVRIEYASAALRDCALQAAQQLALPLELAGAQFALQLTGQGWQLQQLGRGAPGPLRVDFVSGALAHRRQYGGGSGQMLARAVGIQGAVRPHILDATAGLGRDAFVLACLGCNLQMLERNPLVAWLLRDGLQRAAADAATASVVQRMRLLQTGDAISSLQQWQGTAPQVVYLDPMFPAREKSALVKKEMRLLQPLVGDDADADQLLDVAWQLASHRVVVKRPKKAPFLAQTEPGFQLLGKSCRYDIYPRKSLKDI